MSRNTVQWNEYFRGEREGRCTTLCFRIFLIHMIIENCTWTLMYIAMYDVIYSIAEWYYWRASTMVGPREALIPFKFWMKQINMYACETYGNVYLSQVISRKRAAKNRYWMYARLCSFRVKFVAHRSCLFDEMVMTWMKNDVE